MQHRETGYSRFKRALPVAVELFFWLCVSSPPSNFIYAGIASILSFIPSALFGLHPIILWAATIVGTFWINPAKRLRKIRAQREHLWTEFRR